MEVILYREDVPFKDIIAELTKDCDLAMPVDCAGPNVPFVVSGWFVFPDGTLGATTFTVPT